MTTQIKHKTRFFVNTTKHSSINGPISLILGLLNLLRKLLKGALRKSLQRTLEAPGNHKLTLILIKFSDFLLLCCIKDEHTTATVPSVKK